MYCTWSVWFLLFKSITEAVSSYRWKGGMSTRLEGSDHAPVYMCLGEVPEIPQHSTPSLASRYLPIIHGVQQTLGEIFSSLFPSFFLKCISFPMCLCTCEYMQPLFARNLSFSLPSMGN